MYKLRLSGLVLVLVLIFSSVCGCSSSGGVSSKTASSSTSSKKSVSFLHITASNYEKRMTDYYSGQKNILDGLALKHSGVFTKNTTSFTSMQEYVVKQYPNAYILLKSTGELLVGGGGSEEEPLSDNTVKTFMTGYGIRQISADRKQVNFIMKSEYPEKVYCSVLYEAYNNVSKSGKTMYIKKLADKWYYIQAYAG